MSKWIEVDEILKHKCDVYDINDHLLHAVPTGHILSAPSIDIVRCEDCKRWVGESEWYEDRVFRQCQNGGLLTAPNHYCAWGERMEE